jgi:hypothetical protein
MKRLKNIFAILFFCLTLVSCGQTNTKNRNGKIGQQNKTEKNTLKLISDPTNKLTDKVENLEISYHIIGCACPNWIRTKDEGSTDTNKTFKDFYFYIEPAHDSLEIPNYFEPYRHYVKVKGRFYEREDYPQGTIEMEEPMPKAKVFRYSKFEVIDNPNFKPDSKFQTLILINNAISCTCAQWSETRFSNDTNKKIYYWLEPSNNRLIKADTLFSGENLPVIIKVTGQIISENGFPKIELGKVEQDEAGKVFRYTKIEVLQNGKTKKGK